MLRREGPAVTTHCPLYCTAPHIRTRFPVWGGEESKERNIQNPGQKANFLLNISSFAVGHGIRVQAQTESILLKLTSTMVPLKTASRWEWPRSRLTKCCFILCLRPVGKFPCEQPDSVLGLSAPCAHLQSACQAAAPPGRRGLRHHGLRTCAVGFLTQEFPCLQIGSTQTDV